MKPQEGEQPAPKQSGPRRTMARPAGSPGVHVYHATWGAEGSRDRRPGPGVTRLGSAAGAVGRVQAG
jgi:hypothetical protein